MNFADPEDRDTYLREKHKASLHERARHIFGKDGARILSQLRRAYEQRGDSWSDYEPWVRRIFRRCAKKRDKVAFVEVCIRRDIFINGLTRWAEKHPDPADILSVEEYREVDAAELDDFYREAVKVECQLAVIYGERSALVELANRIGREPAIALYQKVQSALGKDEAERIVSGSWWPWINKPAAFIEVALQNERARLRNR